MPIDINPEKKASNLSNEMFETMSRSFDGYNVYRRDAGTSDWGTAVATGLTAFSYTDASVANETVYEYAVSATYTAGESGKDSVSAFPRALVATPYMSDFEADNGGLYTTGTSWGWGAPDATLHGPDSVASGTKLWATGLDTTMLQYTNSWLFAPPTDLSGATDGALVSFDAWYELSPTPSDYYVFYVVVDHNNDDVFNIANYYQGTSDGWEGLSTLIHDSLCTSYTEVALVVQSGLYGPSRDGVYMDNLSIEAYVPPVLALTPTALTATLESGETGSETLNLANTALSNNPLDYMLSVAYPASATSVLLTEDFEAWPPVDWALNPGTGDDWVHLQCHKIG